MEVESDARGAITLSDFADDEWRALFVPSLSSHRDPNRVPTKVAPSTPLPLIEQAPFPKFEPEDGVDPLPEPAVGIATRIEALDGSTQTPPLLSKLIQGHLEGIGMEACLKHQLDDEIQIAITAKERWVLCIDARSRVTVTCQRLLLISLGRILTV